MWRLVFIGFLIAHGLVHVALWAPKYDKEKGPFDPSQSWLFGQARGLAIGLAVLSAAVLVAAGLGLWMHAGWWRAVAVLGLASSMGLIVLYFHPWFLFISGVNVGLIAAIAWLSWPSKVMVGA